MVISSDTTIGRAPADGRLWTFTMWHQVRRVSGDWVMNALSMMLRPVRHGWAVELSDGRELARFRGPGSRWRALRYLTRAAEALRRPSGGYPGAATGAI